MPTTKKGVMERRQVTLVTLDPKLTLSVVKKKSRKASTLRDFLAEREALEPMLSRNIIKLQITDNHILSKAQSKSKSF